ncbi:hypothetical protein RHGRI_017928 [Rhododendron griersonianum]|uniref:Uncharacterized protein n=1 Tax=Rhododendron griersonianum TaxID=479676 RepID=A0AAV6JZQ0_9ERIC|nr:hypothetical protein RHGRI_017928 [Rhododendron griersonianum]
MDSPDVDSLKDNLIGNLDYSNLCTTFEKPSTTPRRSPSEVTELIRVPADGSGELSLSVSMLCSYRFGCWSLSSHPLEYWRFPHDHRFYTSMGSLVWLLSTPPYEEETIGPSIEETELNRGRSTPKEEISLSDLLNIEIPWPAESELT